MSDFTGRTLSFCNLACSTRYVNEEQPETCWNPGLQIRFTRPFQERQGEICGQIETSQGTIYYRILDRPVDDGYFGKREYGAFFSYPSGNLEPQSKIQHYAIHDFWQLTYNATSGKETKFIKKPTGVGILLQSIPRAVVPTDRIVADLGKDLIFKSDPFFSGYHYERGSDRSLEFFVFDVKE